VRRHPEVEHDAVDPFDPDPGEDVLQVGVVALDEDRAPPEGLERPRRFSQGVVVPVDPDQDAAGGCGGQDRPRVPAPAQGAVHVNPVRPEAERVEELLEQHGLVVCGGRACVVHRSFQGSPVEADAGITPGEPGRQIPRSAM